MCDIDTAAKVNKAIRLYFRHTGITYREAAERLGYASEAVARNQVSSGQFGKRIAAKWAKEFGFSEAFLMTGQGNLLVRRSGYQKLVREIESLRGIVNSQRITIEKLKAQLS